MIALRVLNIEEGFPSLDEARRTVMAEMKKARRDGVAVLKIIHGYGSSGTGGRLRFGLQKSFGLRKKEGQIREFIPGEDFSIFDSRTLTLLETVPELRGDPDLNATNEGMTLVWIR